MIREAVRFACFESRALIALMVFGVVVVCRADAQSASTSASLNNVDYGTAISVTGTVSAASGDTLYNNYIWYRRPDGGTGIMWDTYTDYYYQNSRTVTGSITLNQGGTWEFYAYGYTGDAPASQQIIQSPACTVTVNGSPAVANISVNSSSVSWGSTISVNSSVSAATGDTLYSNYVWYRRPDGSTGIMMDTYVDYYYQSSRSVTGSITLNQSGTWQFYAYGYTGNAPASQQVIESQPANVTVGAQPAPGITSPLSVSIRQRQSLSYQIAASPAVTGFGASGLPANLSFNASNGVISGLITGAGSIPSTISATNAAGTTSATLTWNVEAASIVPNGSVYPDAIRQGDMVTFYRAGSTANFGVAWTENKLWLQGNQVVDLQNQPVGGAPLTWTASNSAQLATYYYQLRIADIYYNYADQWIPITVNPLMHSLPYATSYEQAEGYTVNGNLYPQQGWLVQQGAADISSEQAQSGSYGVKLIQRADRAQVLKAFAASGPRTFLDVYARPVAAPVVTDSSAIYYGASRIGFVVVGSGTGGVYVYDGDGTGGGTWTDTGVRFPLNGANQATQWMRLTVDHDYSTHRWQMVVNGVRARSDLAMRSNTETTFVQLTWWGTTAASAYLDNFSASVSNPFPPPTTPSGVSAANITDGSLTLSWPVPSSSTSPVVEYEVQRVGGPTTSTSSPNLVVTGLYPDTPYSFVVRARNQAGYWSGWSSSCDVRTLPDQTPPSVPTGLVASELMPSTARVTWQSSSDNVGVTAYRVYRDGVQIGQTAATTYVVADMVPNTTYAITVRAGDARNNWSAPSEALQLKAWDPLGDYDNDGMPNGWELTYGLNPYSASDASGDTDGDGISNLAEYTDGTNPTLFDTVGAGALPASWPNGAATNSNLVAFTSGTFSVDQSGSSTYTIPIWVSPGTNGMQPSLALSYNSSASNGYVGVGWSLSGISTITRRTAAKGTDGEIRAINLNESDYYSFDGQRLHCVAGTPGADAAEYRTERESFARIYSYGTTGYGPQKFVVKTKAGLTLEFGSSAAADGGRITANSPAPSAAVVTWAIDKITDASGNFCRFYYTQSSAGEFYVDHISYGAVGGESSPFGEVKFDYEDRTDLQSGYVGGAPWARTKRLKTISSKLYGSTVRRYDLTYQYSSNTNRSRLTRVQEFDGPGGPGSTAKSLPAIELAYKTETNGWGDSVAAYEPAESLSRVWLQWGWVGQTGSGFVDVNGDGLPDFISRHWAKDLNYNLFMLTAGQLNTGAGFTTLPTEFMAPRALGHENNYANLGVRFADLDGDGLLDIIGSRDFDTANEPRTAVWLNRPTGWQLATNGQWAPPFVMGSTSDVERGARLVDLDGDGLVDIFWARSSSGEKGARHNTGTTWENMPGHTPPSNIWMNLGDEPDNQVRLVDLNGDGLVDITEYEEDSPNGPLTFLNTGSGWVSAPDLAPKEYTAGYRISTEGSDFVDVNGDGLVDQVTYRRLFPGDTAYSKVWLNTGKGWVESVDYRLPQPLAFRGNGAAIPTTTRYGAAFADVNGDGLVDFIFSTADLDSHTGQALNLNRTYLNTGSGWAYSAAHWPRTWLASVVGGSANSYWPIPNYDLGVQILDIDGNGLPDIIYHSHLVDYNDWHQKGAYLNQSNRPDLLEKITASNGLETSVTYKPLTDKGGVYTRALRSSTSTFPVNDVQSPIYVVRTVTQSDGIGGTYTQTYSYGEMRHSFEVGNLGFAWMKVSDSRADTPVVETHFRQDMPYVGLVAGVTMISGTKMLSEVTNSWDKKVNSGNARVSYPYAYQTTTKSYEPNSTSTAPFLTVTVSTAVDGTWGDLTDILTEFSDGWETHEVRQPSYVSAATAQYPGQMSEMSVSVTASAVAPNTKESKTRSSKLIYDAVGRLNKEIVEPGDLTGDRSYYKETSYDRDTYGNVSAITVSAPGADSRSTTFEYSATYKGRLLTKKSVGAHITEFSDFDTALGVAKKKTEKAFNAGATDIETVYGIDSLGRVTSEYRKLGSSTNVDGTTTVSRFWSTQGPANTLYAVQTLKDGAMPVLEFFDALGRVRRTVTVSGDQRVVKADTTYNARGLAESTTRPYYASSAYATVTNYDVLGRVTSVATPTGTYTHAPAGFTETVSAPAVNYSSADGISVERSFSTETTRNSRGWTTKVVQSGSTKIGDAKPESASSQITYTYDPFGALKSTTDSGNNTITNTPDLYGRRVGLDDPDRGAWSYKYWGTGELRQQIDARQNKTEFVYDNLGRVTKRTLTPAAGAVQVTDYSYDGAPGFGRGNIHTVTMKEGATTTYSEVHSYDSLGRDDSVSRTIDGSVYTFSYSYDAYGRLKNTSYPGAGLVVRRFYTSFGQLSEIRKASDWSLYFRASEFAADGQIEYALYGNGVGTDRSYRGEDGLVQAIQTGRSGSATELQNLSYFYEPGTAGNLYKRWDARQAVAERFTYDSLVRLKAAYRGASTGDAGTQTLTMAYDDLGNPTSRNGQGYAYNYTQVGRSAPMPHAVSSALGSSYTYDATGNLQAISGARSATTTWTAFNQPLTISQGGASSTFRYGPAYERVVQEKADGSRLVYVGREFERQIVGSTVTDSSYIFTPLGRTVEVLHVNNTASAVKYYFTDHLGSVDTVVTDAAVGSPERLSYDAWGVRRLSDWLAGSPTGIATRRGFTDHEMLDGLGLIHMNGRIYDPALGRFMSADPLNQDIYNTQTYNAYSYVLNNPLSYTDPTGMAAQSVAGSAFSQFFQLWYNFFSGFSSYSATPTEAKSASTAAASSVTNQSTVNQSFKANSVKWNEAMSLYSPLGAYVPGAPTPSQMAEDMGLGSMVWQNRVDAFGLPLATVLYASGVGQVTEGYTGWNIGQQRTLPAWERAISVFSGELQGVSVYSLGRVSLPSVNPKSNVLAAETNASRGPVTFRAPAGATAEEIAQIRAYVQGSNKALEAGYLSPTGRVSTKGALRTDASLAAAKERAVAAAAGDPYVGHAGHVPDTTWTGNPNPYQWLDLSPRINSSLGGQAARYPVGYKPTIFIFER